LCKHVFLYYIRKADRNNVAVPQTSGVVYPFVSVTVPTIGLMMSWTKAFEAKRAPTRPFSWIWSAISQIIHKARLS
jgi:hypothetical protein